MLELAADEGLKMIFGTMTSLASFWIHVSAEYPELAEIALKALLPFPSSYLCETGFSTMSIIKTKYRNSMDVRSPLREHCPQSSHELINFQKISRLI